VVSWVVAPCSLVLVYSHKDKHKFSGKQVAMSWIDLH